MISLLETNSNWPLKWENQFPSTRDLTGRLLLTLIDPLLNHSFTIIHWFINHTWPQIEPNSPRMNHQPSTMIAINQQSYNFSTINALNHNQLDQPSVYPSIFRLTALVGAGSPRRRPATLRPWPGSYGLGQLGALLRPPQQGNGRGGHSTVAGLAGAGGPAPCDSHCSRCSARE